VSTGEVVTCTFVNEYEAPEEPPSAELTIAKVARTLNPNLAGTAFDFTGPLDAIQLADGQSETFTLDPGPYQVSETLAGAWKLERIDCGGADVTIDATTASIAVTLEDGDDVTCTFHNFDSDTLGPEGSLTIVKHTVPAGGTGFAFDAGALGAFSLDDGGLQTFTDLAAGAYVVTETPAADWEFASIECDALDYVVDGASVTVNLAEGEAAVCTFTNGELPYTGDSSWLPVLLAGLATVLLGLGVWVVGLMKGARA